MENMISPICFVTNWKDIYVSPVDFQKRSVYFSVPGKPRGKERPRMVRIGNHVSTYTPKNTVEYENLVRRQYKDTVGDIKLENNIEAEITSIFPVPSSASKKKKAELLSQKYYSNKPDCDNIDKIVLDALNKVAYDDDSQVCKLHSEKIYGENPEVRVNLTEI